MHRGQIGALVELCVNDDATALTEEFRRLASGLAMHIVAMGPASLEELQEQAFLPDPSATVAQALQAASTTLRETIGVVRFVRWTTDASPAAPTHRDPPSAPAGAAQVVRRAAG